MPTETIPVNPRHAAALQRAKDYREMNEQSAAVHHKRLIALLRDMRIAKAGKAAIPCIGTSRVLAGWRRSQQRPFDAEIRRLQKEVAAVRKFTGPAPEWHKLRPAKPVDERIRRQYHDVKATLPLWDEPAEPEQEMREAA